MDILIAGFGLSVIGAGVFFCWHGKGGPVYTATYIFGLALVLVGGPLGPNLSKLNLSKSGVEVAFERAGANSNDVKSTEQKSVSSLIGLTLTSKGGEGGLKTADWNGTSIITDEFRKYFDALGFIPTELVGSDLLLPGAVIAIRDGTALVLSESSQAFPTLKKSSSPTMLPMLSFETRDPQSGGNLKKQVKVLFESKDATIEQTSIESLESSISPATLQRLSGEKSLYVVQASIICKDLHLSTDYSIEGTHDSKKAFEYLSKTPVVLAYRLLQISVKPKSS